MIRIKIDKNKKEQPIFKIYIKDIEGYKFLKTFNRRKEN